MVSSSDSDREEKTSFMARHLKIPSVMEKAKEQVDSFKDVVHGMIDSPTHAPPLLPNEEETSVGKPLSDREEKTSFMTHHLKIPSVTEKAKEQVDSFKDVVHDMIDSPTHASPPLLNKEETSDGKPLSENNEKKHHLLYKAKEGLHKAGGEFKEKAREGIEMAKETLEKAKDEFKSRVNKEGENSFADNHHKETHGRRDDIDEKTPLTEVKAPSLMGRAKEEVEAVVSQALSKKQEHPAKDDGAPAQRYDSGEKKKEDGCVCFLAYGLERCCAPWSKKKED